MVTARWLLTCVFACAIVAGVAAQSDTALLSGTASDPDGRAVPGAAVTLRSLATGAQREAVTDDRGRYTFTLLPPCRYELTVHLEGFKQFRDGDVNLQVAQTVSLDAHLGLGDVTESVQVIGAATLLDTTNAAVGTVIGPERISSLPLNGRQFIQLALLVPGANGGGRAVQQNTIRQGQIGSLSVAGGRTNNNAFLLDGATNVDPDYNSLNYSPAIDAIEEFRVQTAAFSAEYGRSSGGQINVVTRSGTNQMHTNAWEFVRNKALDAKPFNLTSPELPQYQRNQFGATLGAPLVKDRLFVFAAYEGLRLNQAAASLTSVRVPTALERQLNFSETPGGIFDPATLSGGVRQAFAGSTIPSSRVNPLALAAMLALPLPNAPGNLFVNQSELLRQTNDNYSVRIDTNLGSPHHVFGRFSTAAEDAHIPDVVPRRSTINNGRPRNAVIGATSVVSARAVNELRFAYNRLGLLSGLPELSFTVGGQARTLPRFNVNGFPTMGGAGGFNGTTGGGMVTVDNQTYQIYDNFSWSKGRHTLKIGGEARWIAYNRTESPNITGTYQFSSGFTTRAARNDGTGSALASFLLGLPTQGTRSVGPSTIDGRQQAYSLYVQDDVRLGRALTLNMGLRYELSPPLNDAKGRLSSIDYRNVPTPAQIFASGKTGFYSPILFVCGQNGYPKGCAYTDKDNFAPRLGAAWQLNPATVLRGGAGVYYAASDANPLFRLAAGLPGNIAQTISSATTFIPTLPNFDIFGPAVIGPVQIQAAGIDLFQETSYTGEWTLSIERQLRRDLVIEVGYLGNVGRNLDQNVQPNNAQPGSAAVDPRRPYGSLTFAPGTVFPDYLTVVGNSVPVGLINYLPRSAHSSYNAGFVRLEKRLSSGFSMLTAYTYGKAITNAPQYRNAGGVSGSENSPPQDSFNLEAENGLAYYDVSHRWVSNVVYDLPVGPTKRFLRSGWASRAFGDLQVAAIYTMQSGFPFTINVQSDTAGVGAGTGGIFVRPNLVPGIDPVASTITNGQYLNTAAFAMPPSFTFGNLGRNTVIGPGYVDLDAVLAKNISIAGRSKLQLRTEAFNLFNRRNYNVVGRIINEPSTFGKVLSQFDPRQLQFGVKWTF